MEPEELLHRAWEAFRQHGGPEVEIASFVCGDTDRIPLLLNLIEIDAELRCQSSRTPSTRAATPRYVEEYVRSFPELRNEYCVVRLLQAEARLAEQYGEMTTHDLPASARVAAMLLPAELLPAAAETATLPAIPGYLTLNRLAPGNQAEVFLALEDAGPLGSQQFVVKVQQWQKETDAARATREVKALQTVHGDGEVKHVVRLRKAFHRHTTSYLVFPYYPLGSLRDHFESLRTELGIRRLPARAAVRLVLGIARGEQRVHACGYVHRDLKPANVVLDQLPGAPQTRADLDAWVRSLVPKIIDFGLVRDVNSPGDITTNAVLGSRAYMAPEQHRPHLGRADVRSDLWALGVILYELLTGKVPFASPFEESICDTPHVAPSAVPEVDPVENHLPPPIRTIGAVPQRLDPIIERCLAKRQDRRYQCTDDLIRDLQGYLDSEPWFPRNWSSLCFNLKTHFRVRARAWQIAGSVCVFLVVLLLGGRHYMDGERRRLELDIRQQEEITRGRAADVEKHTGYIAEAAAAAQRSDANPGDGSALATWDRVLSHAEELANNKAHISEDQRTTIRTSRDRLATARRDQRLVAAVARAYELLGRPQDWADGFAEETIRVVEAFRQHGLLLPVANEVDALNWLQANSRIRIHIFDGLEYLAWCMRETGRPVAERLALIRICRQATSGEVTTSPRWARWEAIEKENTSDLIALTKALSPAEATTLSILNLSTVLIKVRDHTLMNHAASLGF